MLDLEIVFEDAPDFTHMMGPTPQDRFVSDDNGDFWIGTNNLDDAGSLQACDKVNGLYKIAADFSGISTVDAGLAVWNIFKDSSGVIWIGSKSGIHRRAIGGSPQLVYDSASTAWYPEQIIESGGEIYALLKNFFNDPSNLSGNRVWELHQWDSNAGQFDKVCDIVSGAFWDQVHAFVYSGTLYVVRSGNQSPLAFDPGGPGFTEAAAIGAEMGQYRLVSTGTALFSVGNVPGLCIYNLDGGGETRQPTPAGTAEGLIISGWSSDGEGESGGMAVVDLREKTTGYYDSTRIPIASDAIFAIEIQGFDNNTFKLWLGGPNGVSYCEFRLED